jgi:proteasome accessory factor C
MRRRPRPAEDRLKRLLVMLPWLMEQESVPLAEVAERFGLEPDEVAADLELASMCGLPPYVDELIDVFIDEGMVYVGVPRLFTRPLRLNAIEAFELLAAGRAAMQLPGADVRGSLGRGLDKLAAAIGQTAEAQDLVLVDLERPEIAERLVAAMGHGELLDVEYWSASRDEVTQRRIQPRRVFADRGHWYVVAHDERSAALRTFRLDRLVEVESAGFAEAVSTEELPRPGEWFADAAVPRATLRLAPAARWVAERYPVDEVSAENDGWLTVVLPVASDRWLERLLLRLGPNAHVEAPAHLAGHGRVAAQRILSVYRGVETGTDTVKGARSSRRTM